MTKPRRMDATSFSSLLVNEDPDPYVERPKYPELGHKPAEGQMPNGWIVDQDLLQPFNPRDYFATSGEAVAKAQKMLRDAWAFVGRLQKLNGTLVKARGDAKYLEVCWALGQLTVLKKNPRVFKNKQKRHKEIIRHGYRF